MKHRADIPLSRSRLREEAATWFAIMRGPEADAHRAQFEAWLLREALHREAYNRIAETFSLGKALRIEDLAAQPKVRPEQIQRTVPARSRALTAVALAIMALSALGFSALRWPANTANGLDGAPPGDRVVSSLIAAQPAQLATKMGEIRQFRLADGSVATLDTDSLLLVRFNQKQRDLTLVKGRARFAVAHERRPFIVATGGGSVTAVGTVFDVAMLDQGQIDVRLIKGVVDVNMRGAARASHQVRRLAAGEGLLFGGITPPALLHIAASGDADWPAGLRNYDGMRLGDVLADANRYGGIPLRAVGAGLDDIRISGTFRVGNSRQLASNIAEVLSLAQVSENNQIALMRACPPDHQENCRPPS